MKQNAMRMLVAMLVAAVLFSTFAYAAEAPDLNKECALLIDYVYQDTPVAGAKFDLFRVGEMRSDFSLHLTGDFADYPVQVNGLTNEEFHRAADTLTGYAYAYGHTPLATLVTNAEGRAEKTKLESGLYLLVGRPLWVENGRYMVENHLLILPYAANTNGPWQYRVTLNPKAEFVPETPHPLDLQVVKVWDDGDNNGYYRPVSVTVHLFRDGEKYDSVELSAANNWRHEWKNLGNGYSWSVSEDVPAHYTVQLSLEGTKFIVTNTSKEPPPPTPTPPVPTPPPSIPQTGQLWWPVPVLMLLGIAFVAAGLLWRKHDEA